MDRYDQIHQIPRSDGRFRLLHILGIDVLVPVLRRDQPFPVEVGAVCVIRDWKRAAVENCGRRGPCEEWVRDEEKVS